MGCCRVGGGKSAREGRDGCKDRISMFGDDRNGAGAAAGDEETHISVIRLGRGGRGDEKGGGEREVGKPLQHSLKIMDHRRNSKNVAARPYISRGD